MVFGVTATYREIKVVSDILKDFYPTRGLNEAKGLAIRDAANVLARAQAEGFPKSSKEYVFFLRNKGRETRTRFSSLRPENMKIPFTMRWVAGTGDIGKVVEAAEFARIKLIQRAPVRSGNYLASISIHLNGVPIRTSVLKTMAAAGDLEPSDFIFVAPAIKYASTLEKGFYTRYYQTQSIPGGIVRPVAKMVRDAFGTEVACRFSYISFPGIENQALPIIDIAIPEAFPQNDSLPGRSKRRYSRQGRRR